MLTATTTGTALEAPISIDNMLNAQLQQLLADLQLFVPYDVGAAWLGHDDRPVLRVVSPAGASLPSLESARHLIFQATKEAARIADLHSAAEGIAGNLHCWLGVPLVLDGQRRGWVELLSEQPDRFSDADLLRAETLVGYAAVNLAQLELNIRLQKEATLQRQLISGLESVLLAPNLEQTLQRCLELIIGGAPVVAANLILPVELAYALGLKPADVKTPRVGQQFEDEAVMTVVARWSGEALPDPAHEETRATDDKAALRQEVVIPFIHEDEAVGWLSLQYPSTHPLGNIDPALFKPVTSIMTALLVWLREQVQREQQAEQSVRMLVQSTYQMRSGAVADLMAGLAHELNNPISAMVGMFELLRRDATLSPGARADVEAIAAEAYRVSELMKRLLNFGHTTGSTKVPVSLADIVADALALVRGLAQQREVKVSYTPPEESPLVLGSRTQLQQLCLDLLMNAVEAVETADNPEITIELTCEGQNAVLRVTDNGYGIPDDMRERIFTPGFTTKTTGGTRRGLGIGLPMASDIARSHWGSINVTSQIWQGSCFTLRLPMI